MNKSNSNLSHQHKYPTVFIIDDDAEVLQALSWLVESVGLKVESYSSAITFLKSYDSSKRHGCIITDVRMPVMGGIQLFEELNLRKNQMPVIVLTGYGDIPMAVNAMKIGIIDFISKPFNEQYLLEQIQKSVAISVNQDQVESTYNDAKRYAALTKREQQVMKLVVVGRFNKQIAQELCICTSTVEFHRAKVMAKMGAKNLAELIKIALSLEK